MKLSAQVGASNDIKFPTDCKPKFAIGSVLRLQSEWN